MYNGSVVDNDDPGSVDENDGGGGGMMIKMMWRSMATISDSDRYAQEENQG